MGSQNTTGGKSETLGRVSGYLVCVAGFVVTVAAFYPGVMSPDSFDQWEQGRAWAFNDVHPPIMSALWGLMDRAWAGPAGMLLLHNALFWGAAALFRRLTRERSRAAGYAFAAFGFMPQVLSQLGAIWKDVGLGAALFMASALLYGASRGVWRFALLAACPLLFYGYGVRLNAAPAVLPLALWSGFIACGQFPKLRARASSFKLLPVLLGLAYFAVLTAAVSVTTRRLTDGRTSYPYQQILLHDLTAVLKETGRSYFPPHVTRAQNFSAERVSELYTSEWVNTLIYGQPPPLRSTLNPDEMRSLRAAWWDAVSNNRLAYLSHRWAIFRNLTGLGSEEVYKAFNPDTGMNNPPQFRRPPNALTRALTSYFFLFANSPFFRGFLWILACLALVYLALRLRLEGDLGAVFALSSSGLLYAAAYFFVAPSSEFRYLWWTVLSATASAILFAMRLAAHRRVLRRPRGARVNSGGTRTIAEGN
jgi:hypothetical protein